MLQHRQDVPEEIASRPHRYDEVAKKYVAVPYPEPQLYPKWLYKEGKSRTIKNEKDEKTLLAKGWSNLPPPIPGDSATEDDDLLETAAAPDALPVAEVADDEDLVPVTSSPERVSKAKKKKKVA